MIHVLGDSTIGLYERVIYDENGHHIHTHIYIYMRKTYEIGLSKSKYITRINVSVCVCIVAACTMTVGKYEIIRFDRFLCKYIAYLEFWMNVMRVVMSCQRNKRFNIL